MKDKVQQRLQELKSEFESGQKMLADLETQQATLKTTLFRISGAIQVLEEMLSTESESGTNNAHVPERQPLVAQSD